MTLGALQGVAPRGTAAQSKKEAIQ